MSPHALRVRPHFQSKRAHLVLEGLSQGLHDIHRHVVNEALKKKFKKAVTINRSRYEVDKHDSLLIPRIDMGKKISLFKIFLKMETFYEDIKYEQNELYL